MITVNLLKMKLNFIVISAAAVFFSMEMHSQITISNSTEIAKIKTGTTFFAMKDPASPKAAAFVEAIKKNWTLSKVECIKYTDVEKNIAPNNSFVTIGASMKDSNASTQTNFALEFWTTDGKFTYIPNSRKHYNPENKILIASVALFPDYYLEDNPSSAYKTDYDGAGHLKNWSANILGNYIQQLTVLLNKAEVSDAKTEFMNKNELGKLGTLYIPEYVLIKYVKNSDDESKTMDPKEITEGLGLNCKIISVDDLNNKITKEESAFYYLMLIKTNSGKWITVTNSKTGEIIYSTYSGPGNFKVSDLKDLQKATQRK